MDQEKKCNKSELGIIDNFIVGVILGIFIIGISVCSYSKTTELYIYFLKHRTLCTVVYVTVSIIICLATAVKIKKIAAGIILMIVLLIPLQIIPVLFGTNISELQESSSSVNRILNP